MEDDEARLADERLKERKKKKIKDTFSLVFSHSLFPTLTLIPVRNLTINNVIMNVRRLPGFMYNYKLATVLLVSSLFLVVYLLLYWGVMCTNLEAWRHVSIVVSLSRITLIGVRESLTLRSPNGTRWNVNMSVKVCKG